jgi:hypothetical protein
MKKKAQPIFPIFAASAKRRALLGAPTERGMPVAIWPPEKCSKCGQMRALGYRITEFTCLYCA